MTSKHTPGPWRITDNEFDSVSTQNGGLIVAHLESDPAAFYPEQYTPRTELLGNARLIAAAPDLLAACEAVIGPLPYYDNEEDQKDGLWVITNQTLQQCEAAIAKAKGEQCTSN